MCPGSRPLWLLRNLASRFSGEVSGLLLADLSAFDVSHHSLVLDPITLTGFSTTLLALLLPNLCWRLLIFPSLSILVPQALVLSLSDHIRDWGDCTLNLLQVHCHAHTYVFSPSLSLCTYGLQTCISKCRLTFPLGHLIGIKQNS